MPDTYEVELMEIVRQIWRKRLLVLSCTLSLGAIAFVASILSPRYYRAQALIRLPETGRVVVNERYDLARNVAFNIAETRAILEDFSRIALSDNQALKSSFRSVVVEPVRGSESFFRLSVSARDPGDAERLAEMAWSYLAGHQAVEAELGPIRASTQSQLDTIEAAIARVEKERSGHGATSAEVSLASLREKRMTVVSTLANVNSYRMVSRPIADQKPLGPRSLANAIIYAIMGLMAGIFSAMVTGNLGRGREIVSRG